MATITPLVHPYPDFQEGDVINPEQFDDNNEAVRDKVNEIIVELNTNVAKDGEYLATDNEDPFTPTNPYEPATKKYVDDADTALQATITTYIDNEISNVELGADKLYDGVTAASTITITTGGAFEYEDGRYIQFQADADIDAPVTIDIDGGSTLAAKDIDGEDIAITINTIYMVVFKDDAPDFFLLAPRGGANGANTNLVITPYTAGLDDIVHDVKMATGITPYSNSSINDDEFSNVTILDNGDIVIARNYVTGGIFETRFFISKDGGHSFKVLCRAQDGFNETIFSYEDTVYAFGPSGMPDGYFMMLRFKPESIKYTERDHIVPMLSKEHLFNLGDGLPTITSNAAFGGVFEYDGDIKIVMTATGSGRTQTASRNILLVSYNVATSVGAYQWVTDVPTSGYHYDRARVVADATGEYIVAVYEQNSKYSLEFFKDTGGGFSNIQIEDDISTGVDPTPCLDVDMDSTGLIGIVYNCPDGTHAKHQVHYTETDDYTTFTAVEIVHDDGDLEDHEYCNINYDADDLAYITFDHQDIADSYERIKLVTGSQGSWGGSQNIDGQYEQANGKIRPRTIKGFRTFSVPPMIFRDGATNNDWVYFVGKYTTKNLERTTIAESVTSGQYVYANQMVSVKVPSPIVTNVAHSELAGLSPGPTENAQDGTPIVFNLDNTDNIYQLINTPYGIYGLTSALSQNLYIGDTATSRYVVKSLDGGVTWFVLTGLGERGAVQGVSMALGLDGLLHIAIVENSKGFYTTDDKNVVRYFQIDPTNNDQMFSQYVGENEVDNDIEGLTIGADNSDGVHIIVSEKVGSYFTLQDYKSVNSGVSWSKAAALDRSGDSINCKRPALVVTSDEVFHVVFEMAIVAGFDNIHHIKYTGSWSSYVRVSTYVDNEHMYNPKIAINSSDDLHVTWHGEGNTSASYYKVQYCKSLDDGATWSTDVVPSGDAGTTNEEYFGDVFVDTDDDLWILARSKAGGSGSNEAQSILLFYSDDNGATFSTDTMINVGYSNIPAFNSLEPSGFSYVSFMKGSYTCNFPGASYYETYTGKCGIVGDFNVKVFERAIMASDMSNDDDDFIAPITGELVTHKKAITGDRLTVIISDTPLINPE